MKELDFLKIIEKRAGKEYIGDDCAYLKEFGIVITQDNFVEGIHFRREWYTPYQLGRKAVLINISDILASGAKPEYITIGLSLSKDITAGFVDEFYKGASSALYGAKIAGGDITASDKIFISITAVGSDTNRKISSRSHAKSGYAVIVNGKFGESSKGLEELINGGNNKKLIDAHINPKLDKAFSENISLKIKEDYAMADTSDGLADALFKIAQASGVTIETKYVEGMFGAEDYKLAAVVPYGFLKNIDKYELIGEVKDFNGCYLEIEGKKYSSYDELDLYDHFGG